MMRLNAGRMLGHLSFLIMFPLNLQLKWQKRFYVKERISQHCLVITHRPKCTYFLIRKYFQLNYIFGVGHPGPREVIERRVIELRRSCSILSWSGSQTNIQGVAAAVSLLPACFYILGRDIITSRGDIVIAKSPFDPQMNICKRVIGLEGDKICTSAPSDFFKTHTYVPMGHVWLEGDNLKNSTDSRNYGPIPYALIRGRVYLKLWPLHSFGMLSESPTKRIIKAQSDSDSD